jgi:hypothetical protein
MQGVRDFILNKCFSEVPTSLRSLATLLKIGLKLFSGTFIAFKREKKGGKK